MAYSSQFGAFTYGSRWLAKGRCERCGWVVALNRGTIDQEIDLYAQSSWRVGGGWNPDLLRRIFTAILADAPPDREAQLGHRSELLAHAAEHRPIVTVCEQCARCRDPAAVHGEDVCPDYRVVCGACTFRAGPWAGDQEGVPTAECVVAAPCSVLTAMAAHYLIAVDPPTGGTIGEHHSGSEAHGDH
ncbi:hypothetical protein MSM1_20225 [Mycobacterium sp. SM1]|uniref:hypothetical protein n=1 Tax=Mycobacterium sp. SM1 TaxID=2816243 RepID=UPI001BCDE8B8|nr:hypothetical protein [Mycobacterium sp. SM1]MBS4730546.1 hypothetical protein [Mycobacterium sp. SM1]